MFSRIREGSGIAAPEKREFVLRTTALIGLALITALYLCAMTLNTRIATIRMGEAVAVMRTIHSDPAAIVADSAFSLQEGDLILHDDNGDGVFVNLSIQRRFAVSIRADGVTRTHHTYGGTVHQILCEAGVPITDGDLTSHPFNRKVEPDMEIRLARVSYETVQEETEVPYDVRRVPSTSVPEGRTVETQPGVLGLAVTTLENKYIDGTLTGSRTLSSETVRQPVTAVFAYGTGGTVSTTRSAATRFSYVLDVTATAYTYGDGGSWGDVTATGKTVQVGFVAVDPRVIPLGSRLYITYPDGSSCYGFAVAEDTGGAIKGNRVDLFYENREDAIQFGRRKVKVYVLAE